MTLRADSSTEEEHVGCAARRLSGAERSFRDPPSLDPSLVVLAAHVCVRCPGMVSRWGDCAHTLPTLPTREPSSLRAVSDETAGRRRVT